MRRNKKVLATKIFIEFSCFWLAQPNVRPPVRDPAASPLSVLFVSDHVFYNAERCYPHFVQIIIA
jgi:hypothetical protein